VKANLIPAIAVGILAFVAFRSSYLRWSRIPIRAALVALGLCGAAPAILFASNYTLDIPYARWFHEFHAMPGAEITAGLSTAILGVIYASAKLRPARLNTPILVVSTLIIAILVLTPFAKQVLRAVDYDALGDKWEDGVCIQSTHYTCVPACVATYVRMLGGHFTERELAQAAGTTTTGTEFWYLARALRRRGYEPAYRHVNSIGNAPVPSILGVKIGRTGHVVVLLGKDKDGVTIAEPLRGRRHYSWALFYRFYMPDGSCVTIERS